MKLGILSQWFDPEPGPAAIPGVYAREFIKGGHEVSVLTAYPNYPDGKIYPGFRQRPASKSVSGGIRLTRVPVYPSHDSSTIGRMANYVSFASSATVFGGQALRQVDGIWVYNSPITVSLPLLIHSKWGKVPYFLQVQDLWPDSLIDSGMFPGGLVGKLAAGVISAVVRLTENRSVIVGVSSPGARDLILERNPRLSGEQVVAAPNPTDESIFRPIHTLMSRSIPDAPWRGYFTVMYVGAVGEVQGLDSVVDAAELLRSEEQINFVIVGDGIARQRLEARARAAGLRNVTFVGRVEKESVPGLMATADVQLVALAERPFLRYTTPSKIASLLASQVPIIGQLSGDGAELIHGSGAGILAKPEDADSLAAAVTQMEKLSSIERSAYAARGRSYYEKHLSAEVAARTVVDALGRHA